MIGTKPVQSALSHLQARGEVDRIVEARRSWVQSSNGMTRPEQALQELALIVSESEAQSIGCSLT